MLIPETNLLHVVPLPPLGVIIVHSVFKCLNSVKIDTNNLLINLY